MRSLLTGSPADINITIQRGERERFDRQKPSTHTQKCWSPCKREPADRWVVKTETEADVAGICMKHTGRYVYAIAHTHTHTDAYRTPPQ